MRTLVIIDPEPDAALPRLLRALGADFRVMTLESVVGDAGTGMVAPTALILSDAQLASLAAVAERHRKPLSDLLAGWSHVLVHPISGSPEGLAALGRLTGGVVHCANLRPPEHHYEVAGSRAFCGAFAGLSFGPAQRADRPLTISRGTVPVEWWVTVGGAGVFGRLQTGAGELFIHASTAQFDVTAERVRNLAAAECFSGLIPLLWFLRHARTPLRQSTRPWANWIIDDPNLTPRYGCLRLADLARTITEDRAAATIGFIPWNHRRTSRPTVDLIRTGWPRLAICVHGCNHTRAEFATATAAEAHQLGTLALARMRELAAETALGFERVMVFPQGKFSAAAMSALRHLDLLAVVNTEVVDSRSGAGVRGGDLLSPAVTAYGGLPLFLRRPAGEPMANFALDLALGKPCLVVTHHEYFAGGIEPLRTRVAALNQLEPRMTWTTLEDGISATTTTRLNHDYTMDVRLFAPRTSIQLGIRPQNVSFWKHEPDTFGTVEVTMNGERVRWLRHADDLYFTGSQSLPRSLRVDVVVASSLDQPPGPGATQRFRIAARRYLSEFRDNYVEPSPRIKSAVSAVRTLAGRQF